MVTLLSIDWAAMWIPEGSILEIVLRGTLVYLALLVVLRILRRETGSIGINDVLLVVLIGDASQNAMAAQKYSITEGMLLVATIAAWDFGLDWLSFRFPLAQRMLRPAPLLLIKDGKMIRRNMRQEMVTHEELMSQLRQQGVDAIADVRKCFLEGDGHFSVITRQASDQASHKYPTRPTIT